MGAVAVDIVIDNFDYGRFVARAIESALAQTHRPVRVIVVDDGSTDDSRAVIAGFFGRVTAVLKDHGGQASAVNAGFARCRGDVVIFLDSDDELLPDAAARAAAVFAAAPATVLVQQRMAVMDADGRLTGRLVPPADTVLPSGDLRRAQVRFPFDIAWMGMGSTAFATAALAPILPMPEAELATSADWYLRYLVPLRGPVRSLQEVGAHYRVHGANGYARAQPGLDLDVVRQSVRYGAVMRRHIAGHAAALGLARPPGPILSVSDLGQRMVSLRLDPERHPLAGDRRWRLAVAGATAPWRRDDVRWPMKLAFAAWFAAMAVSPARLARPLAEAFVLDGVRRRLARVIGGLRRPVGDAEPGGGSGA